MIACEYHLPGIKHSQRNEQLLGVESFKKLIDDKAATIPTRW